MSQNPTLNQVFGLGTPKPAAIDHQAALLDGSAASFWPIALPWAKQAHAAVQVDISVILAQWAIETAYGGVDWLPPRNNPGNVGNFTAGGQLDFPTLAAGVEGYIQCMLQGYYVAVRDDIGWYAQSLALGQSPWAGARYALPGSFPGSELISLIQANNLTQYDAGSPAPTPPPAPAPVPVSIIKPTSGRYGVLNAPVVAVLSTKDNKGYTLVGADGGTFNYGDAPMLGSLVGTKLNAPIVDAAFSPSGAGLYLVGTDGGVFCFGDAVFHGSAGALKLAAPVVSISVTETNGGYWLTGADGGIFTYGDAAFYGTPA